MNKNNGNRRGPNCTGFSMIQRAFSKDPEVNMEAKALLQVLAAFAGRDRLAWPAIPTLQGITHWSPNRIGRVRRWLLSHGYLKAEEPRRAGGKIYGRRFWISPKALAEPMPSGTAEHAKKSTASPDCTKPITRHRVGGKPQYGKPPTEVDPKKGSSPREASALCLPALFPERDTKKLSLARQLKTFSQAKKLRTLAIDRRTLDAFGKIVEHFYYDSSGDVGEIMALSIRKARELKIQVPPDVEGNVRRILGTNERE